MSENVHKYEMFNFSPVFTMSENVHKYEMFTNFSQTVFTCQKTFTNMKCSPTPSVHNVRKTNMKCSPTCPRKCSQCQKTFTNMKCSPTYFPVYNTNYYLICIIMKSITITFPSTVWLTNGQQTFTSDMKWFKLVPNSVHNVAITYQIPTLAHYTVFK